MIRARQQQCCLWTTFNCVQCKTNGWFSLGYEQISELNPSSNLTVTWLPVVRSVAFSLWMFNDRIQYHPVLTLPLPHMGPPDCARQSKLGNEFTARHSSSWIRKTVSSPLDCGEVALIRLKVQRATIQPRTHMERKLVKLLTRSNWRFQIKKKKYQK